MVTWTMAMAARQRARRAAPGIASRHLPGLSRQLPVPHARRGAVEGVRGLAGFCQFVRGQIDLDEQEGEAVLDPGSSSGVVLMTIHQAKGLQFPCVILPDLNAQFNFPKDDLLEVVEEPEDSIRPAIWRVCQSTDCPHV